MGDLIGLNCKRWEFENVSRFKGLLIEEGLVFKVHEGA
jgi:hypothetical protein